MSPTNARPPRLSSIDVNLLVVLDALLRERNVTDAGRLIGLTQPAMSHALARLRELLGDPLLVRDGRAMHPSALAERLAPRVRQLVAEMEAVLLAPHTFDPRTAMRTFRIATNDYCEAVLLPDVLARVRRTAPRVDLELHAYRGPAPRQELARGELDVAVGVFPRREEPLEQEVLFEDGFACVVRRGHPRVRGRMTLERYVDLDHVLISAPDYGPGTVDVALAERGMRRRVVLRVPHFLAAPAFVSRTDLVLTLPARVARTIAEAHGLRVVVPPLDLAPFAVRMMWNRHTNDDPSVAWLRDEIRAAARPLAASSAR